MLFKQEDWKHHRYFFKVYYFKHLLAKFFYIFTWSETPALGEFNLILVLVSLRICFFSINIQEFFRPKFCLLRLRDEFLNCFLRFWSWARVTFFLISSFRNHSSEKFYWLDGCLIYLQAKRRYKRLGKRKACFDQETRPQQMRITYIQELTQYCFRNGNLF